MLALRRSGPAACHHARINDLPDPVLAHIFSFLKNRDSLYVLLVSKAWLAVAGEHCGAFWDAVRVDGSRLSLEGGLARRDFHSRFLKRAANVSTLHVLGREKALPELLPSLLKTLIKCSSSRLRELHLEVEFWRERRYTTYCRVSCTCMLSQFACQTLARLCNSLGRHSLPSTRRRQRLPASLVL